MPRWETAADKSLPRRLFDSARANIQISLNYFNAQTYNITGLFRYFAAVKFRPG